jgi:hypothetical protein
VRERERERERVNTYIHACIYYIHTYTRTYIHMYIDTHVYTLYKHNVEYLAGVVLNHKGGVGNLGCRKVRHPRQLLSHLV